MTLSVRLKCLLNGGTHSWVNRVQGTVLERNPGLAIVAMQDQGCRFVCNSIDKQNDHLAITFAVAMMRAWTPLQRVARSAKIESLQSTQACLRQLCFYPGQGLLTGAVKYAKGGEHAHQGLHHAYCMDSSQLPEAPRGVSTSKQNGLRRM